MKKILLTLALLGVVGIIGVWLLVRAAMDPERMRTAIEDQGTKAIGVPLHVGAVSSTIYPRIGLVLSDVTLDGAIRVAAKRVSVSTGLLQLLKKRIEDADILVRDARIELAGKTASADRGGPPASPGAGGDGSTGGSPGLGITIVSIRNVSAENIELVGGGKSLRVTAKGSVQGNTLELSRIAVAAETTAIEGTGRVSTATDSLNGELDLKAARLDVDELLSVTTRLASALPDVGSEATVAPPASGPMTLPTPPPAVASQIGTLKVTLVADSGRLQGMEFKNLLATVTRTGTRAEVDPFSVGLFDGTLKGRVRLESIGPAIAIRVNGDVTNANVAAFLKAVEQPGRVTGSLNASMALAGRGADFVAAANAMAGTATFTMAKGRIDGLDVVNTVLKALGATPGAPRNGESYERMSGAFRIQPTWVQTDNFVMTAPDFEVRAALKLARGGEIDGKATVLLGEAVSSQIGAQYRAARLASEQNRLVLPASIGGTLDKPRILPDVKDIAMRAGKAVVKEKARKAIDRAIGGLFKRKP